VSDRTRWVVREGEGTRLSEVLLRAGADAAALAEGRVFVGRKRARSGDEPVRVGDEVFVARVVAALAPVTLLFDEDGLVAAEKPADSVTIPDHAGSESLLTSVARALGVDPSTLHATSRLDRGVSGVVVFARTDKAAAWLKEARERGVYDRRYIAIATRAPEPASGEWDAPIGRAKDPRHRAAHGKEPAPALSRYAAVALAGAWAMLALEPVTGRTHQLRVHASHAGAPLLGDRVYGGPVRVTSPRGSVLSLERIALHAARVRLPRRRGGTLTLEAPVPDALRTLWKAGAGEDDAWARALLDLTALRA
jgi:23S rRNA-/tRNA-specific pseudouridylate synthase